MVQSPKSAVLLSASRLFVLMHCIFCIHSCCRRCRRRYDDWDVSHYSQLWRSDGSVSRTRGKLPEGGASGQHQLHRVREDAWPAWSDDDISHLSIREVALGKSICPFVLVHIELCLLSLCAFTYCLESQFVINLYLYCIRCIFWGVYCIRRSVLLPSFWLICISYL